MGGGLFVFPILVVGLLVVVALVVAVAWSGRQAAERHVPPDMPSLGYEVPAGQDPVVVLTALHTQGYTASTDATNHQLIRVACPDGTEQERPRVREVIGSVHTTALDTGVPMDPGAIRFTDET
jgi:hypothetical protein